MKQLISEGWQILLGFRVSNKTNQFQKEDERESKRNERFRLGQNSPVLPPRREGKMVGLIQKYLPAKD